MHKTNALLPLMPYRSLKDKFSNELQMVGIVYRYTVNKICEQNKLSILSKFKNFRKFELNGINQCCGAGAGGGEIILGPGAGAENKFQ